MLCDTCSNSDFDGCKIYENICQKDVIEYCEKYIPKKKVNNMGKCDVCKKKIEYNSFVRYRKQILCKPCYKTHLARKKAKKLAEEEKAKGIPRDISKNVDAITPSFVSDPLAEDKE